MARLTRRRVPQFVNRDPKRASPAVGRSDRAIYRVGKDKNGAPIEIAIEVIEGGGNVPRDAATLRSLAGNLKTDLQKEFKSVAEVAELVLSSLKALQPGEVEIEFGVELGGEIGVPLVTKGEAKANFKITLKWKKDAESE